MAGFHTHITVSSVLGVGYAWLGEETYHLPWQTSAVAGTLCAIGGMMPDLDSDSGVPARETISFVAAIAPMLLVQRLQHHVGVEPMLLFGAPLYLLIRFGLGRVFRRFTVHRGMFHSLPAMGIAFLITYLACDIGLTPMRTFKAGGMALGFFSHLLLDEIWSVQWNGALPHVKKSFGTAIKFFGDNLGANSMCYGLLILLGIAALQDTAEDRTHIARAEAVRRQSLPAQRPLSTEITPANAVERSPRPVPRRITFQARSRRFDTEQE